MTVIVTHASKGSTLTHEEMDANFDNLKAAVDPAAAAVLAHVSDTGNPHVVTKSQVGLGNVDNTSDANKPVSTAQGTAIGLKEDSANKSTSVVTDQASDVKFPSVKAVYDWATGLFEAAANKSTSVVTDQASDVKFPSVKAVYDWVVTTLGSYVGRTSATGSAVLPAGTTAQRDETPSAGYTRFNSELGKMEVHTGSTWSGLGGADGNGGDAVFYVNDNTVDNAYTIPTGKNAMCAGPITFNAAVTVPSGSRLTVV